MKATLLVSLMLTVAALIGSATPTLTGSFDGTIGMDTATGAMTLNTTITAEAAWDKAPTLGMTLTADELGEQTLATAVSLDALALSGSTTFDVSTSSFAAAAFSLSAPLLDAELTVSTVLEPGAVGAQLTLTATGASVIRSLTVGFNVDLYGRIQTTSCTLPFTCAEARFSLPLDNCDTTMDARISFDAAGFSELNLSTPHVGALPFAISLSSFLTFMADEKTITLSPSLNLENPDCFDFYAGLEWDTATHTLSELLFYGMGMRCALGEIQLRMLVALDPSVLALVKSPYRSLLGLVWPLASCCCGADGEASLVFFFGTDNLFDLEEIDAELSLPITEHLTLSLSVEAPMTGQPAFTLGWQWVVE
ncbi:MAG: hypothetical protein E4H08_09795 [Candidatus Atribacteria bacterium]|nr:MAG: hypothetical protein E4H08_09795 [Candidatus Atribacteria bacterium]